jgi:hypothetical protein
MITTVRVSLLGIEGDTGAVLDSYDIQLVDVAMESDVKA